MAGVYTTPPFGSQTKHAAASSPEADTLIQDESQHLLATSLHHATPRQSREAYCCLPIVLQLIAIMWRIARQYAC